jgi:hypothetical protein
MHAPQPSVGDPNSKPELYIAYGHMIDEGAHEQAYAKALVGILDARAIKQPACPHRNLGASEMTSILAPSNYSEMRERVSEALGLCRSPILIGFDGRDGDGKTSAANWLAWQFGMPAIHLDLFYQRSKSESAISWRTDDLARCFEARGAKPIIVEGVLLLDALAAIEKSPDYLVFVEKMEPPRIRDRSQDDDLKDPSEFALSNQISRYFDRRSPATCANFKLVWSEN